MGRGLSGRAGRGLRRGGRGEGCRSVFTHMCSPACPFLLCFLEFAHSPLMCSLRPQLSIWNCDRRPLGVGGFYGISWPDSDSLNPRCGRRAAAAMVVVVV